MAQNITESESWDTPLTIFSDGDALNGANFLTHLQKIANRLKYIGARLGITGSPAPLVKQYTDIAALKAVNPGTAGYTTGDVVWVDGAQFYGPYRYDSASATAEALPLIVAPTTGSGRWFHALYDLRPRDNAVTPANVSLNPPPTSWTDVTGLTLTFADAKANDVLIVELKCTLRNDNLHNVDVRAHFTDGASTVTTPTHAQVSHKQGSYASGETIDYFLVGRQVLGADGSATVKIQWQTIGATGGDTSEIKSMLMQARIIRGA